jgi:hypothetical protein
MAVERKPRGPVFADAIPVVDLRKRAEDQLTQCGPHDYGLVEMGCNCSPDDPRPVISELLAAFDREKIRTEMMAYQRGAVLHAVHSMQLGNHTVAEVAARVEEIFSAGMTSEIKHGYDEALAGLTQERDRLAEDSKTLNAISFAAATALGLVPPGIEEILADPVWLVERLIAEAKGIEVER